MMDCGYCSCFPLSPVGPRLLLEAAVKAEGGLSCYRMWLLTTSSRIVGCQELFRVEVVLSQRGQHLLGRINFVGRDLATLNGAKALSEYPWLLASHGYEPSSRQRTMNSFKDWA